MLIVFCMHAKLGCAYGREAASGADRKVGEHVGGQVSRRALSLFLSLPSGDMVSEPAIVVRRPLKRRSRYLGRR